MFSCPFPRYQKYRVSSCTLAAEVKIALKITALELPINKISEVGMHFLSSKEKIASKTSPFVTVHFQKFENVIIYECTIFGIEDVIGLTSSLCLLYNNYI